LPFYYHIFFLNTNLEVVYPNFKIKDIFLGAEEKIRKNNKNPCKLAEEMDEKMMEGERERILIGPSY
jgi:hypothetical protein